MYIPVSDSMVEKWDSIEKPTSLIVTSFVSTYVVKKASSHHNPALQPTSHDNSTSPLDCYASYLRAVYSSSPLSVNEKWPPTLGIQYISLAIIETEDITQAEADEFTRAILQGNIKEILKKKKAITIEDVLKPREGQLSLRCVLVDGAPGIGKSSFVWELCRKWDEIEVMRGFSLVVLLRLREKRVQDAIVNRSLAHLFYIDSEIQQAAVKEIKARNGAGVLIVFDGLDELPKSLCQNSLFSEIIQGTLLPKCTVLVTSRPSASAELIYRCKPRISKHIEVLGFTECEIDQYAQSVLGSDPVLLDAFFKYLNSAPSIRSIMYVPLNSAIVLQVYKHTNEEDRPISTTTTQLYNELSRCLLKRYMLTESLVDASYSVPEDLKELPQQVYKQFCSLAELAFKGTMNEEVIFHQLPTGFIHMGFMSSTPELYVGRKESHNFLHLTVQEYLTAFHISQLPTDAKGHLFRQHLSSRPSELPQYSEVWRFMAGLTCFKHIGWDWILDELDFDDGDGVGGSDGQSDLVVLLGRFHVQCLYEAQVALKELTHTIKYDGTESAPLDGFAAGYCVAHSTCVWNLDLSNSGPNVLKMLVCGMKSKQKVSGRIARLDLSDSFLKQQMNHMNEMPPVLLKEISLLKLISCSLDGTALDLLADAIPLLSNLSSLDISFNCDVCGGEMVKLFQSLLQHRGVWCFKLIDVPVGALEIELLSQLITPSEPLKELAIGSSSISTEDVEEMITTVISTSSLSSLEIWDKTDLTSSMYSLLEVNSNLTILKFQLCTLEITSLARVLRKNTTLKVLHIVSVNSPMLSTEDVTAMSEVLIDNHSLEEIKLENRIGQDGILTLVSSLQHNTTLRRLILVRSDWGEPVAIDPRVQWI